ncbi:uncharacterized protein K452DRAFT_319347 [Aplosporella prunicola CBS 121167]|uniref:Uncharacterized protein n=1 Tax=Aplosporella prunicola CBS 121167 TaxID=1176127 RepID=A0A6A6BCM5_9PEZI|nr:uncharacterized protein K452DRAFT_319347 [Aplosporella prunicola CBS 121167]KAF2141103.1 hypothetical protein K452DRAFT_319347 [Aplosporella prunicola CBS 121167]
MSDSKPPFNFLGLSPEIRLLIYHHVLSGIIYVNLRQDEPGCITSFKADIGDYRYKTLTPAIIRTCKQICHEVAPILYSRNSFLLSPRLFIDWLDTIGPVNVKYLRYLKVFVPPMYTVEKPNKMRGPPPGKDRPTDWYAVLNELGREATNLRLVTIEWQANVRHGEYGGGKDMELVRCLGTLHVEKLTLAGFYARHWPDYLRAQMGQAIVVEMPPHNDLMARRLREFQEGTEDLVP